jgi:hypothetical protein
MCTLARALRLSTPKLFEIKIDALPDPNGLLVPVPGSERYNRLFNSSFAFCRWAASAPPIRICSTESVAADAGLEIGWSWL